MHAFDRQTDGQTDTFLLANPRWHSMQRRKNRGYWGRGTVL